MFEAVAKEQQTPKRRTIESKTCFSRYCEKISNKNQLNAFQCDFR